MGDFLFNVARGRAHELHRIVDSNVIAASALKLVVLTSTGGGLEDDEILRDYDTLGALLAASNNEPTNSGYARKTLDDTVLSAATIDDINDQVTLTYPTQTWTAVAAGDTWAKLLTCIDFDTAAGTDTDIIPITAQDMLVNGAIVVPSGVDIQWQVPGGYYVSQA